MLLWVARLAPDWTSNLNMHVMGLKLRRNILGRSYLVRCTINVRMLARAGDKVQAGTSVFVGPEAMHWTYSKFSMWESSGRGRNIRLRRA